MINSELSAMHNQKCFQSIKDFSLVFNILLIFFKHSYKGIFYQQINSFCKHSSVAFAMYIFANYNLLY